MYKELVVGKIGFKMFVEWMSVGIVFTFKLRCFFGKFCDESGVEY